MQRCQRRGSFAATWGNTAQGRRSTFPWSIRQPTHRCRCRAGDAGAGALAAATTAAGPRRCGHWPGKRAPTPLPWPSRAAQQQRGLAGARHGSHRALAAASVWKQRLWPGLIVWDVCGCDASPAQEDARPCSVRPACCAPAVAACRGMSRHGQGLLRPSQAAMWHPAAPWLFLRQSPRQGMNAQAHCKAVGMGYERLRRWRRWKGNKAIPQLGW